MRALWIDEWDGPLQTGERPDPEPAPGEVLIDVESCAIGLTVLNCIRGDLGNDPADLPRIPGHEAIGRIVGVGEGVDPARVGERVGAYMYLVCGRCRQCLSSNEPLCGNRAGYFGVTMDGGYAERATVPALNAIPIPEGIEAATAVVVPDAMATPVHVSRLAGIRPGDRVAVIAAGGGLGVHMVQVARIYGGEVAGLENDAAKQAFLEDELDVAAVDSTDFGAVELPSAWGGQADVI
ncbi:MAG: alcohol dehydrogenase catalytic domain-containing protein, partial [Solirubrobacterales bacterium]